MGKRYRFIHYLLLVILLSACGRSAAATPTATAAITAPQPTVTTTPALPRATFTALPTATAAPTRPPTPTTLPTLTAAVDLPLPVGTPAHEWQGLPIMPDATAGDGDAQGYWFTITATPTQIQEFYDKALTPQGWSLLTVGTGQTGNTLMIYQKEAQTVSIAIIPRAEDHALMQVLLVR